MYVDDRKIVDLRKAFALVGTGSAPIGCGTRPVCLLDIIKAGPGALSICKTIADKAGAGLLDDACLSANTVSLAAPIPRPAKNVFCVGSNYRAHVTEASRANSAPNKTPDYPVFFSKPPTCVIGPGDTITIDPTVSEKIDYEVELAVVFGKTGRNISVANAQDHIFGFTIINDVTARDLQRRHGGQFLKGKGQDTFCPMGPQIVTIDELPNFADLRLQTSINGEGRQDGNSGNMIFSIPTLIESLSEGLTLEPGDILATGTPEGVGYAMDPPSFLKAGDTVVCEIEGIGKLENTVGIVGSA
ncbi:MAG: fumarylacetoacetate hydrolase family protein [Alphaproteobacteria bacterium]